MQLQYKDRVTNRWWYSDKVYRYRFDSVPGVHKWAYGSYFRSPKTLQELKSGYIADDYDKQALTAYQLQTICKQRRFVPTAWDDIPRARRGKGWKNFRRFQYRS